MKTVFLQADFDFAYFLWALIVVIVSIIITVLITRWVFKITTIVRNLERQSFELVVIRRLLVKIATKQDLTPEEAKQILETTNTEMNK